MNIRPLSALGALSGAASKELTRQQLAAALGVGQFRFSGWN